MATIISKQKYQIRAKKLWQEIINKEFRQDRSDISVLEYQLARLERKLLRLRSWG